MDSLPCEMFFKIMIILPYNDCTNVSSINKKSFKKCVEVGSNNYFWYKKYIRRFAMSYVVAGINILAVKRAIPYDINKNFKEYYYVKGYQ